MDKYLGLLPGSWKKTVEHERDGDTNYSRCTFDGLENIGKDTGEIGNRRKIRDYLNHRIIKIS